MNRKTWWTTLTGHSMYQKSVTKKSNICRWWWICCLWPRWSHWVQGNEVKGHARCTHIQFYVVRCTEISGKISDWGISPMCYSQPSLSLYICMHIKKEKKNGERAKLCISSKKKRKKKKHYVSRKFKNFSPPPSTSTLFIPFHSPLLSTFKCAGLFWG